MEIKLPSSDDKLGDRTLYYSIGKKDNGIIWSGTYSYKTMDGKGDVSLPK